MTSCVPNRVGCYRAFRAWGLICAALLALACDDRLRAETRRSGRAVVAKENIDPRPPVHPDDPRPSVDGSAAACERRIAAIERNPGLPGTPRLDSQRAEIFLSVKGEPALFIRPPDDVSDSDPRVLAARAELGRLSAPEARIAALVRAHRTEPELLRAMLLRDGYVYAEDVALARALVSSVRADQLFASAEITIERGERRLSARRDPRLRRYVYVDGPSAGRPVTLILFDRVSRSGEAPPLHRDLRSLRHRLGFSRARVRHLASEQIVVDLEYGDDWVPTLLRAHGARLELACEVVAADRARSVGLAREENLDRSRGFRAIAGPIARQIDEALPFDEPKHEVGQEDGALRELWRAAHGRGEDTYSFRGDVYPVFDARGRPLVPQVCVDFLLDTFERAAGTWWTPRGAFPERQIGRLDLAGANRGRLRSATEFVRYAADHPRWFDVLEIEGCERVPLGWHENFSGWLAQHASDFLPGDMVLIAGCVPWDPLDLVHYHSFFIFESDPLTGMPLSIAGNAGRPSIVTWNFEMLRTPERTLRYRIRPDAAWLAGFATAARDAELEPPPLSY
jgi:hypothetical protein